MMEYITIRQIPSGEVPMELICEADESPEAIEDYLSRGEVYAAFAGDVIAGEYVLLRTRPFTAEIVNVAVAEGYRNRGIGRRLIEHAIDVAKTKGYRILEIATGNCGAIQIALYLSCGFKVTHVEKDYFPRLYPQPIFENGMECRDMVRMQMYL